MKNLNILVMSLAMLGLAVFVSAEEGDIQVISPSPTLKPRPSAIMEKREEIKQNIEQKREEVKQNMEQKREEIKQNMEERRETIKEEMERKREELKDRMEQKREELKGKIEAKREELKTRLNKIKDERKKQVVERIDKSLDALNEKMTKHFLEVLNKLEEILVRIEERTNEAAGKGIDISSVTVAIGTARQAIADAKAAVETQAGKTYTLEVNTETTLRPDIGKARQALHADLRAVQEKVKMARDAVYEAARAFAKAHGRDLPSPLPSVSPTTSVSPSPSPTATP